MRRVPLLVATVLMTAACASVKVIPIQNSTGSQGKALSSDDSGIRFYRPAWYVWITHAPPSDKVDVATTTDKTTVPNSRTKTESQSEKGPASTKEVTRSSSEEVADGKTVETTKTATFSTAAAKAYQAQIVELPDFSQEYMVQWRPGLGSVTPEFTLSNGWNLVAFKAVVDSKASELVTSIGALAAGGLLAANPAFKGAGLYRLEVDSAGRLSLGALVLPLE